VFLLQIFICGFNFYKYPELYNKGFNFIIQPITAAIINPGSDVNHLIPTTTNQ